MVQSLFRLGKVKTCAYPGPEKKNLPATGENSFRYCSENQQGKYCTFFISPFGGGQGEDRAQYWSRTPGWYRALRCQSSGLR